MKIFELFIGFRYLKSKKTQGFISFNTFLSMFIVFLGVFILIVVISVMNGFQAQIKDKILDVDSHITLNNVQYGKNSSYLSNHSEISEKIRNLEGVTSVVPYYQGQGLMRRRNTIKPVLIRGLGSSDKIPDDLLKFIDTEKYPKVFSNKREIFIGEEMALINNIKKGDYLQIIVSKGNATATMNSVPNIMKFKVIGFFKTGYYEFDTSLMFMSMKNAQRLFSVGNRVSAIGIKIKDIYSLNKMSEKIQEEVGYDYNVYTTEQRNQNLFYALKLEKLIMTIILFLVIVSASFTIMGTLVMVVMEKRKAVGILKAIGAGPNSIMTIFILEGFLIGFIGTIAGVVTGLVTALNLHEIIEWIESFINGIMRTIYLQFDLGMWLDISIIPRSVYYIEGIPVQINPEFVVFIAVAAMFISTVSAVFPAWHASRLNPVESIRYE